MNNNFKRTADRIMGAGILCLFLAPFVQGLVSENIAAVVLSSSPAIRMISAPVWTIVALVLAVNLSALFAYKAYTALSYDSVNSYLERYKLLTVMRELAQALKIWSYTGMGLFALLIGLAYYEIPGTEPLLALYGLSGLGLCVFIRRRSSQHRPKLQALLPRKQATLRSLIDFLYYDVMNENKKAHPKT